VTQQQLEHLVDDLSLWLDSYAHTTGTISDAAVAQAATAWARFNRWYDDAAVAALAAQMAELSSTAQQQTSGAAAAYISTVAELLGASSVAGIPRVPFSVIRNGAPLPLVHTRPAEAYRRAVALGATHQEALEKAGLRARGVMGSDLTLQQRQAEQTMLETSGVTSYRRIVRPELSRTGTCGLCIAAADRVYDTGDLMPIHPPSCKCTVLPIFGDVGGAGDPGLQLNRQDIGQLYADAGSTRAAELARTRYTINEHGEYGPVLTREGDAFRGRDRVALEDDPLRARRLLKQAAPVLALMRGGEWEGTDPAGAMAYSEALVARLEDIVGAAA
jgi:hypothetical protein